MYTICWIDINEGRALSIPLSPATADVAHAFVVLTWDRTENTRAEDIQLSKFFESAFSGSL